jgi:hypothetical protein
MDVSGKLPHNARTVQRSVQDEWQGETRLRFKLRGLSAPPCAQCCARTRFSNNQRKRQPAAAVHSDIGESGHNTAPLE